MKWEVVIGLEVHSQLSTVSKIFSGSSTAFGAAPNTQASAVDLALPGVLPVLNRGAVERAIKFGLAVGAKIHPRSIFARKNYFYPDLPKGYQISQFEDPIVQGGALTIVVGGVEKVINLTRAHLEEDAGKSLHEEFQDSTGIDLNRAGTPLLEIVSEPEMRSSAEAVAYAKALHSLVTWLGICDGNMQEGSFRVDANVSVRPFGQEKLGTRREIKNLNSFRFLQQAIDYEVQWQIEEIEDGRDIIQATILFDSVTGKTQMMRTKEDAHDYRYFPDPDLLPVLVSDEWIQRVQAELPELPQQKKARYQELGLSAVDAAILSGERGLADYFEAVLAAGADVKQAGNWIMGELSASLNRNDLSITASPISPLQLSQLLARLADDTLTSKAAKTVFEALWQGEGDVDSIIKAKDLVTISDSGAVEKLVDDVLTANPAIVAEYKAGKEKALMSLVGQIMKASKGKANPNQVNELLKQKLAS